MTAATDAGRAAQGHMVVISQQIDGWLGICAEGDWRYENTSPSIVRRAAEHHMGRAALADGAGAGGT